MSVQDSSSLQPPARPSIDDHAAWRTYWRQAEQVWRTEPEISEERQQYLTERRGIVPNIENGVYPFKDIKLSRADIEWLLATHEHGRGPVDWASQWEREGLDLRGADLQGVDLSRLPLVRTKFGLATREWWDREEGHVKAAGAHLEEANLEWSHLEGADLRWAHLESAFLYAASLEGARLRGANLSGAVLQRVHLEGASFRRTYLGGTKTPKPLPPANLTSAFFDTTTDLEGIILGDERHGVASLADVSWGNVNLSVVDWAPLNMLGDEYEARQIRYKSQEKNAERRLREYRSAVRANRQLAVALRSQGLDEEAARFAYRAQKLQRIVLRLQSKYLQYLFSLLLDLLAGYGYRPIRTLLWYVILVAIFATAYALYGHLPALPDALVFSLTSFHGRGFFPGLGSETTLHNPLVVLAAAEAVIGLFIEISFIATFTQRYFGK